MKYCREYIVRRAFDVFMDKGYDSASISILQEELNMSRGAMYRYFKNKEELFICVIDEYFFNLFNRILQNIDKKLTTAELIEKVYRRQQLLIHTFARAGVTHMLFLNYTALIIQAAKHYPEFLIKFNEINNKLLATWRNALENSIKAKEIKEDVDMDTICQLFSHICINELSTHNNDADMFATSITNSINKRKQILDYLYSLIKV